MKGKLKNVALIIGISVNVVLVLFFAYLYFYSVPKEGVDVMQLPKVTVPNIDDSNLKREIATLEKVPGIPIYVDESELGKQNPYNP